MNAPPDKVIRIDVPSAGAATFLTVLAFIAVFFTGAAVFNLRHWSALSPLEIGGCIVWLCLVASWLAMAVFEAPGWRRVLVNCLGSFARSAFIDIGPASGRPALFRFGFTLLGHEVEYEHVALARIGMVNWHAGQASAMSGKECADWTVAVWYRNTAATGSWRDRSCPGKQLFIVTPYLPRAEATAIGTAVVAQLREAGVTFVANNTEDEFTVVDEDR